MFSKALIVCCQMHKKLVMVFSFSPGEENWIAERQRFTFLLYFVYHLNFIPYADSISFKIYVLLVSK